MAISSLLTSINRVQRDIADIQKKISDEKKRESQAVVKINQIQKSITKSTSSSTLRSKMSHIARLNDDIAKSSSKQAELSKKYTSKTIDLSKYQQQLTKEQETARKKQEDLQKRREREHLDNQRALTQELEYQKRLIEDASVNYRANSVSISVDIEDPSYDVFISHASEDKDEFVRPLAEELIKIGVKVWYDEFSLRWGDSLRESIDKGLANSKFGVIVISSSFISKKWPQYEVNGLVAREIDGGKVILPIWHKVTKSEVLQYSPTLADRLAMNSSVDEIPNIAKHLKEMI